MGETEPQLIKLGANKASKSIERRDVGALRTVLFVVHKPESNLIAHDTLE